MDKQFSRNLRWGYGFSLIILAGLGLWSYLAFSNLLSSNRAVRHSNEVIRKLEQTMSVMKDAETGQRGFLLTNRRQFLEPYNGAYRKAQELLTEATMLTSDNPEQQRNMQAIREVLTNRLNILKKVIDRRLKGDILAESDLDTGKLAMDALRKAIDKAENTEQKLLQLRENTLNSYVGWTPILLMGGVLLGLIITGLSYIRVVRDITEKERLRRGLEDQEAETAALNEELTAANEEITAANEELTAINEELLEARDELQTLNDTLEGKVKERTAALAESEEETQALNEELTAINEELAAANEEYQATNENLLATRENLEKSERLFRSIAENIPGSLLMLFGPDYRVIALEGDRIADLNYYADSYIGKHIAEVTSLDRFIANEELYKRVLAGEQFRIERGTDKNKIYQVDFVPLKNDKSEIYAALVIALDVTEIKQAEERSAKLAAIVESSDDAIIGKTLEGTVTSWNKGAERLFGYTEADMIGQSILKVIPEERYAEEPEIISKIKSGQHIEHFETQRLARDGRLIDLSLTISPVRDKAGNVTGVSKIARDISEKKRDEQRKNDFIGMASHELKTPLTSLSAILQVLDQKMKNSTDSFMPGALTKANQQIKRMSSMINGFLNVSRLESAKLLIEKAPFNLGELAVESIAEAKLAASSHEFIYYGQNLLIINADREKINSVISNLLSNAVKYSPKGKLITIRIEQHAEEVIVSVHDEGIGIQPQDIDKLFDRYYRVENEHTKHISGFGVGLYLSSEIVKHHEGRIWVESGNGTGSTFYFTLPV